MKVADEERNDYAVDALVREVERRRDEKPCRRYSYGRLVADTTMEEREGIAERYLARISKVPQRAERFEEPDDDRAIQKVAAMAEK